MDFVQSIRDIFKNNSERTFIIESQTARSLSYSDFYNMAYKAAVDLRSKNIQKHDRVALILNNSVEFAALYYACLFAGAVAMPVNPTLHAKEINFIVSHSDPKLLVYSPSTKKIIDGISDWSGPTAGVVPGSEKMKAEGIDWSLMTDNVLPVQAEWTPLDGVKDEDLFSVHFTSGTTSLPKGVPHRIGVLMGNALAFNNEFGVTREDRFLHVLPMSYMAGFLNTILSPFMAEASVVLSRQFDAASALRFWGPVVQNEADTFWLTPTILSVLSKIDRSKDGPVYCREKVKNIFVGTAPLPLKTKDEFETKYGIEVFESYGLSEVLFVSANSKCNARVRRSVGRILNDIEIQVRDEEERLLQAGFDGEILLKTPFATPGYLDYQTSVPSGTGEDGWFPTGDIGHVDQDRNLFITSRKKDLIIKGGLNISPRAIEETMMAHPDIEHVAVVGVPNELQGEEIVAAVQLKSGRSREDAQLSIEDYCKRELNANAAPARYVFMHKLPAGVTGKVQKAKIVEILAEKSDEEKR